MATDILVHTDPDPGTAGMPVPPSDEVRAFEEQQQQIVILDVSEARRQNARDLADARLSEETQAGGGVRGFVRKIWKGNIAHEYYRQKYTHQAMEQIDESRNLYAGQDYDSREATGAVVDRFTSEYADELLHQGERRVEVGENEDNRENPMRTAVQNLIGSYARDELNEGSFEEEKNRVLKELARQNPAAFGEGMAFADNLLEVARNVKAQVAHGRGLEEIMASAKFVVGEARMGVRTEANYNRVDRIVERIHSTRVGSLLNESTIATAAALVAGVTKWGAQKTTGAALAATGAIGASGAVFAAVRENKRFKQERAQHMRESAMGKAFEAEAARRGKLEQTRYGTKAATELAAGLNGLMNEEGRARNAESPEQYIDAVKMVAEAHARIKMSDREKIDLVHFSDVGSVEKERFDLDLALARAKVALRHQLEERGGDVLPPGLRTSTFDQLLAMYDGTFVQSTHAEISQKDAVFDKMRRMQVAKAAAAGALIGSAVGVGIQEGMAHLPGIGDNYQGLGEDIEPGEGGQRSTLLRGVFEGNRNVNVVAETDPLTDVRATDVVNLKLPDGFNYEANGNTWTVTSPDGQTFSTIQFDGDGKLTADSIAQLESRGVAVSETLAHNELSGDVQSVKIGNDSYVIPKEYSVQPIEGSGNGWQILDQSGEPHGQFHINFDGSLTEEGKAELQAAGIGLDIDPQTAAVETTTQATDLDANELIWYNAEQTERVHRVLWYGNDTPGDYDQNELRTHAGGVNGSWFDEQGNAVLDISRMTADGSYQGGQEANPFQLTGDGRLSLAVSVSKESQDTVFTFDFMTTPEGRTVAIIPPDSPVHQLFEIDQNGNRVFNGRYLEVMEMTGQQDEFGEEVKILGTFVGESNTSGGLVSEITEIQEVASNTNTLTFTPPVETMQEVNFAGVVLSETNNEVVPVVPVPVFARRGLESAIDRPGPPQTRRRYEYGGYGPYGEQTPEEVEELIDSTIPELRDNPRARIPTSRATSWYRTLLGRNRGSAYVADIDQIVANSPNLLTINNQTRAIVTVPVAALSEGDNIFQSLSLYGQQSAESQSSTQVLLHVNWARDQAGTPEAQAKINRTMDEIARAQAAYPDLNITIMQSQWTPEQMQGGVIGNVVRKMFDTAILATNRAINDGRMDPDHEVVIIRNDADAKGISRDYIGRMVETVTRDDVDAAAGRIRWGIDQTKVLPGLALTMQVYEGIRGSAERARAKGIDASVETIGINTGVRLSTLAAVGSIGFGSYTGAGSDDLTVGGRIKAIRNPGSYVRQEIYRRQHGGRVRGWLGRRRSSYASMVGGDEGDSTVVIAAGAMVDSDVSRLEGQYRNGESVTGAWGSYDQDGYRSRTASLPANSTNESLSDFETIADRVEFQINSIINNWSVNPAHVEMELKRSFPSNKSGEEPMYDLKVGKDGKMSFKFTDSGVDLLKKRATRNNRGQFDGLGTRRVRVNYGRRPVGAALKAPSTPRLVEAQA